MNIRQRIAQYMVGRNGVDPLSRFLLIVFIVLALLSSIFRAFAPVTSTVLYFAGAACFIYNIVRMFSRNISARRRENDWYLRKKSAVVRWFRSLRDRWQQRKEYRFFRCPSCRSLLRVPKNKGRLQLTCRKCGNRFERRT